MFRLKVLMIHEADTRKNVIERIDSYIESKREMNESIRCAKNVLDCNVRINYSRIYNNNLENRFFDIEVGMLQRMSTKTVEMILDDILIWFREGEE